MVAVLVPSTLAERFKAACTQIGIAPDAMLSYLATRQLYVLDADCAEYVRGFKERFRHERAENLSLSRRAFAALARLGRQLDVAAIYVAAALIWEHIDVLENSPGAYGNVVALRKHLTTRKHTVGIYSGLYQQVAKVVEELEAPSVRGLIYRIFNSLDLGDAVASLEAENLYLFKRQHRGDTIYPVFVPYHIYYGLKDLKDARRLSLTLAASVMLQHELDALRTQVVARPGQTDLERWMLALEHLLIGELDD